MNNSASIFVLFFLLCLHQRINSQASRNQQEDQLPRNNAKFIDDIYDESTFDEARFFSYDYASYNTSIAFTIPVFTFVVPAGSTLYSHPGMDINSFGVLTFAAIYILAALGVALYTTTGGKKHSLVEVRGFGDDHCNDYDLLHKVYKSLSELSDVFDINNCARLSVCTANAEPKRYGLLSWPFRFIYQARMNTTDSVPFTSFEKAALFGSRSPIEKCYYEYPCIVEPLDFVIFLKDYLLSSN